MILAAMTILGKDLRLRVRDRSVIAFALVVPLGLTVLFSFVFPDIEEITLTAAVVDEDGGTVSHGFVDGVLPELVASGLLTLREVDDRAAADAALVDGSLDAVWILPAGFSDAVTAGRPADLEVVVNPDRGLQAQVAQGVAEGYALHLEGVALAVATSAATGEVAGEDLAAVAASAAASPPVMRLVATEAADLQLDPTSYLAAGMAVFFVFFTVQFGVTGLLEEKQLGTMPRLLAAPISPTAIHLGKALGAAVLGVTSMAVLAVASRFLLGAAWGAPLGVAILILAVVAAAIGLMTLVGSFARTAEQAGNLQAIVAIVLGMLGGVFFPLDLGEGPLRLVSLIAPHGWFLRGISDLVGSGRWTAVLPAAAAMLAFGIATAVPAALRLRRTLTW
jgi:ABC-2 type transport system permease protein